MKHLKNLQNKKELLFQFKCGLERETLRLSKNGNLSTKTHPTALGSPLTHPYFLTDFGEAQLEWNTPPFTSLKKVTTSLHDLMSFTMEVHPEELFWPYSMPCALKDPITIARYGSSYEAQKKELYRRGLCYRYGKTLQMISSLHFNFSLQPPFWDYLYDREKPSQSKQAFINDSYFKLMRNFIYEGWILTYLFGSSPAIHESYLKKIPKGFKKRGSTLYRPEATSIRMSDLGYYSRIQNQLMLSFNDLNSYLKDMEFAISTPYSKYQQIGTTRKGKPIQINDHFLQIENEHYARIRPKRNLKHKETPLIALKERGVEYIEVRSIDVNPFTLLGIDKEGLLFLHQFLLYCLLKEDFTLNKEIRCQLIENQQSVSLEGRNKELHLKNQSHHIHLKDWAKEIFTYMKPLTESLGKDYVDNLFLQEKKIRDSAFTPSAQILEELKTQNLETFGLKWAQKHAQQFTPISPTKKKYLQQTVEQSLQDQKRLETASEILLEGYETLELSTQILMKEALNQNIEVQVLDPSDNLISLKKGTHIEYVKQATQTSQDSLITVHLMKNKHATKQILQAKGFSVPHGKLYSSLKQAEADYTQFEKKKMIIKPKSTNYGIGIHFIEPYDKNNYLQSIKKAFLHEDSVLVETFHLGQEYRFLIINDKVEGIVTRIPAHVIGDGVHTIKELTQLKNHDPSYYRSPKNYLHLTQVEKQELHAQKLSEKSIPAKNKTIFLRKNSNVSTGGDAIDMTGMLHPTYPKIAINATKAIGAKICGVDMIIRMPKQAANKENYAIIELNHNPVLFIHAFPNKGKKRPVAKAVLKLLKF